MKTFDNLLKVFTPAVVTYLVLAFVLAWMLFLAPLILAPENGIGQPVLRLISWSVAMWVPGLSAIMATMRTDRKKFNTLRLGKLGNTRYYLWAWVLPMLMVAAVGLLTWALGLGTFEVGWKALEENLPSLPEEPLLTPGQLVALQAITGVLIGPLINTVFTIGEELGWRGFLLPRLLPLGQTNAILVSGIIWGVWHAPVIVQGHNYPEHPVLGTVMMVVFTTLLGFLLGWLYFETRSPWAPALAHGTVNAVAGLPYMFLVVPHKVWGGTLTSVTGFAVMGAFVLYLYLSDELPVLE